MRRLWFVAALAAGCGGASRRAPEPIVRPSHVAARPGSGTALVGIVCPEGRPRFLAGALRREREWVSDGSELRQVLSRGTVKEVAVLGFLGRRVGRFAIAGATPDGQPTAIGGYAGAHPCADEATAAECQAATRGCGLATGIVGLEEAPRPLTRTACAAGGHLLVDIDGDGLREAFAVAELAAGLEEVGKAAALPSGDCTARPAGSIGDGIDLIGVADLDLDGRMEVAVGDRRQVMIYTAAETPARLDRVAVIKL